MTSVTSRARQQRRARFTPLSSLNLRPIVAALAIAGTLPSLAHAQAAATTDLPAVTVNATSAPDTLSAPYAGGQVARGARLGILGNQDFMDVPFSVTSFTAQAIQNQQARTVADVVSNVPGIRTSYGFGNFSEAFMVRGFQLSGDDLMYNGLYGIAPRQLVGVEGLERVEVFLGANAFLGGVSPTGTGIGGSINLVPKFATEQPISQATVDYTSDGQAGAHFDLGRRFGPDNRLGVRINGLARGGDAAVDNERRQQRMLTVGLDYQGDRFRINGDFGYQKQTINQARGPINLSTGVVPRVPGSTQNFAQPWTNSMLEDTYGTVRAEYDIASAWTAYVAAGVHHTNEFGDYAGATVNGAGVGTAQRLTVAYKGNTTTEEAGVRGKFDTGPVKHQVNVAWSGVQTEKAAPFAFSTAYTTNIYDAPVIARPPDTTAPGFVAGNLSDPGITGRTNLSSYALSDTLALFDDRVLLTGGVRYQNLKIRGYSAASGAQTSSYDESATSPAFGIVVKPIKSVSLYYNHMEGLAQGPTPPTTSLNRNDVFAPIKSKQNEVGAKWDAGKFGTTLAFYEIKQPTGLTGTDNVFRIAGNQRNRGVELSGFGEAVRGVRLLASVAYIDTRLSNTGSVTTEGKSAVGVPTYTLNAGAEWDLPWVPGLTLSGRYLQTGSQYANATNTAKLSSWNRFDLGGRYSVKAAQQLYTFRAGVENLADKAYWASSYGGYLVQGAPRTFKVSMTVDF